MIATLGEYIHIPFHDGDNGGMDCFTFAEHFRKNEYNKDTPLSVPSFCDAKNDLEAVFVSAINQQKYITTQTPKNGDLCVMSKKRFGKWHHVGIYLDNGVIHCTKPGGVQYHPLDRLKILFPFYEFYTENG
jgi:cell wall-associated NlpC family hydrolase